MNPTVQIIIGCIIIAFCAIGATIGGIMVKNGLEGKKSIISASQHILSPQAEKLLSIIYKHQKELGLNKLIIARDGTLHFDEKEKRERHKINIIGELYDIESDYSLHENEFENLILSIPSSFLKTIPEIRWDSPYVVQVTEEGITYLRKH